MSLEIFDFVLIFFGMFLLRKKTKLFVFPMYSILLGLWLVAFFLSIILKEEPVALMYTNYFKLAVNTLMVVPVIFGGITGYREFYRVFRHRGDGN